MSEDWLSRYIYPDLYPRESDPFRPGTLAAPPGSPQVAPPTPDASQDIYGNWVTLPGQRPYSYQRAANTTINVLSTNAVPLTPGQFLCDGFDICVPSTLASGLFFGYGQGVTTTSGRQVQPGQTLSVRADNNREQWELQRMLEIIASMMAQDRGYNSPGQFLAPRVVLNANEYFVIGTAPITVALMVWLIPPLQ